SNSNFPRSIRYCLDHMREAIVKLEGGKVSHYSWELFAKIDQLTADFDNFNFQELEQGDMMNFLNEFQNGCNEIGQIFSKTYYLIDPDSENYKSTQNQTASAKGITSMKYKIEHTNIFKYDTVVDQSMNSIRLKPR